MIFMRYYKYILILAFFLNLFFVNFSIAADSPSLKDAFKWDGAYLDKAAKTAGYNANSYSVDPLISTIVQTALSLVGVIFLVLMIYGGYLWMTARGAEEQVTKAKNLITAAVIGLIIVLAAYAISIFVMTKISPQFLK